MENKNKPRIKIKSFEKSFERFIRIRCLPAVANEADVNCEYWPIPGFPFEYDETKIHESLTAIAAVLTEKFKRNCYRMREWKSSNKTYIEYPEGTVLKTGMPHYLQLTFSFTKHAVYARPVLHFKLFIKRYNVRKRRITMLEILL